MTRALLISICLLTLGCTQRARPDTPPQTENRSEPARHKLSKDATDLLREIAATKSGVVFDLEPVFIAVDGSPPKNDPESHRDYSRWRAALDELTHFHLVEYFTFELTKAGTVNAYRINNDGYMVVENGGTDRKF